MAYGSVTINAAAEAATSPSHGDNPSQNRTQHATPSNSSMEENQHHGGFRSSVKQFYDKNFGLFLVLMAQVFGSLMTMSTRLLETSFDTKFHALQIIFVRMSATCVFSLLYMWHQKTPDAPFGDRSVRGLLILRGMSGFIGLFALYYSLAYLNLSDTTVITFLTPILTAFLCFVALREPFTLNEALAGVVALAGVIFIARPTFLFPQSDVGGQAILSMDVPQDGLVPDQPVTPTERLIAVLSAILGAFFAAAAYSTIRVIGKRAHSLVSVNYFAMIATVGSFLIIIIHPDLHFEIPQSPLQWVLLTAIGLAGFLLQFLLTEGLQREKGGRATNLIYTQLVFALIIERVVWGTTPSRSSVLGGTLIIAAAIWSSVQKKKAPEPVKAKSTDPDEESGLLSNEGNTAQDRP